MKRFVLALMLVTVCGMMTAPRTASAAYRRPLRNAGGFVGRQLAIRLYYSNFGRSYIPGTGYGGFARPAFGWRGY